MDPITATGLALTGTAAMYNPHRVSGRYRPIDTESLVRQALERIGLNADIRVMGSRSRKSTRHGVVLRLSESVVLGNTVCFPQIYVRNSYAGESSLRINVGFYRLICSNGMVVGTDYFDKRIRHVQAGVDQLGELMDQLVAAVAWIRNELPGLVSKLQARVLTSTEITAVLDQLDLSKSTRSALDLAMRHPLQLVRPEDRIQNGERDTYTAGEPSDGEFSAWNLWNLVNEYLRRRSRSELRQVGKNLDLLQVIQKVAA